MSGLAAPSARSRAAHGPWPGSLALVGLVIAWLGYLYGDTAMAMFAIWARSETFQHCFLIVPISAWLIWRERARLAPIAPAGAVLPLLLAMPVGVGWLLGELTAVNALTQFALVGLLVLSVPALLGWRLARAMAFPLGFLFLAVPFGEFVMPYMMERTADFTVFALRLSGVVVYREGLHFNIPSGSWSVVEACSGVRYLIASLTVGLLFAHLNYRSLRRRIVFVLVAIAVPIVANWLRAYIIVMLGHLSGNAIATGVDHLIYGWVFFGAVIMIMFAIGARWSEDAPAGAVPAAADPARGSAGGAARPARQALLAGLFMGIVALPAWAHRLILSHEIAAPVSLTLPEEARGWRRQGEPLAGWRPAFENPSADALAAYAGPDAAVGVYVAYYRNQNYGRKLVSSTNVLVASDDPSWAQVRAGSATVEVAGQPLLVRTAELRSLPGAGPSGEQRLLVWRWYWIGGRLTSSDREAKLLTAWSRLTGAGDDSAVVILHARKDAGGGAERALAAFAAQAGGAIEGALGQARAAR